MHILEVDLNYTQYHPLGETYISLYPPKESAEEAKEESNEQRPKPPMWAEVEKCMEEGTLHQLRNRKPVVTATKPARPPPKKLVQPKSKPSPKEEAPPVDTTGMNRRQRRSLRGVKDPKVAKIMKNKSLGFAKNQAFGATEGARADEAQDGNNSDGGFFDE
jgi:hypothetical protein